MTVGLIFSHPSGWSAPVAVAPGPEDAGAAPKMPALHTATTHPMKYFISVPKDWSRERTWPVLVAPSAHYGDKGKTLRLLETARDARHANLIIVSPLVINADPVKPMTEYRGAVADSINAADIADGFRNANARAKFDSDGIIAVLADVRSAFRGEDRVYIAGFSASTHVAYLFLFTHPELLKGVVINSGVYLGRGVDEDKVPFVNSPERSRLPVKFVIGEQDNGYKQCAQNWEETRAQLVSYGHDPAKLETEVVRRGNPSKVNASHNWFPGVIFDFISKAERDR